MTRQYRPDYEIEGPHRRRERRWRVALVLIVIASFLFNHFLK